jgi:hypothetical protein
MMDEGQERVEVSYKHNYDRLTKNQSQIRSMIKLVTCQVFKTRQVLLLTPITCLLKNTV